MRTAQDLLTQLNADDVLRCIDAKCLCEIGKSNDGNGYGLRRFISQVDLQPKMLLNI